MVNQDPVSLAVSGVVVVVLVDYLRAHRAWGWLRLVQGASAFKETPGLLFTKVMGSGHQGGFSLRPSPSHQGLICVFDHADNADIFLNGPWLAAYRERAKQCQAHLLSITSCKGSWDGHAFDVTPEDKLGHYAHDPIHPAMAAITRASIRPAKAVAFWRYAPAAQVDLARSPGCEVAMGLGEAPLVRQCTFSVWRDTQAMLDYAHTGAHQLAIQAAYKNNFFSESMFMRMRLLRSIGEWVTPQEEAVYG